MTTRRERFTPRATGLLGYEEPDAHCLPQGVPKINMAPVPFRVVQTDKLVVIVYEAFNLWRQVHLDGRDWAEDLNPSWMGYSKGRWEGDALVVESSSSSSATRTRSPRAHVAAHQIVLGPWCLALVRTLIDAEAVEQSGTAGRSKILLAASVRRVH